MEDIIYSLIAALCVATLVSVAVGAFLLLLFLFNLFPTLILLWVFLGVFFYTFLLMAVGLFMS